MIPTIGASKDLAQPVFDPTARFIVMQWPPFTALDPRTMKELARRTGLPYLERTAGIQTVKRAPTLLGDAVRAYANAPLPPAMIAKLTAALLSGSVFAGGAILDQLPLTKFEAVELTKYVRMALLVDLGASVADLTHRAAEDRRCTICRSTYQWRRPPGDRTLMCINNGCRGLLRPFQGQKPEDRVKGELEKAGELAAYYRGIGVPHVVIPAGNDVPEDAMLDLLVAAITSQPVTTSTTSETTS